MSEYLFDTIFFYQFDPTLVHRQYRDSRFECAGSHEFRDQYNALPAFGGSLPGVVKTDNIGML